MTVSVHVRGEIEYGRLHEYLDAVEKYKEYRSRNGYVVPKVFLGLSGPMNTVLMVYRYDDSAAYEEEEAATARDKGYAEVASQMPYLEGTIYYELFKEM
ncbi:MAG: NIPSNAP family protein [Candidatus Geothermarchaeales archaeon]